MTKYWLTLCLPGAFIIPSCSAWMFHLTLALDIIWWRLTNAYLMKTNKCRHVSIRYRGVAKIFRMRKQAVKEMRTQSAQRKFGVIILHYLKKKKNNNNKKKGGGHCVPHAMLVMSMCSLASNVVVKLTFAISTKISFNYSWKELCKTHQQLLMRRNYAKRILHKSFIICNH